MRDSLKKCDGNAVVGIPMAVLKAARFAHGQVVDVREEDGRIIIEPVRPACYDLDGLLAGVTGENRHEPVDFGVPVGREAW